MVHTDIMNHSISPYQSTYKCTSVINKVGIGAPPQQRYNHAIAMDGRSIYLYGGCWGNIVRRKLWYLNIDNNKWICLATTGNSPFSLRNHTMVYYKNQLFLFGGNYAAHPVCPFWIIDLDTLIWREFKAYSEVYLPSGRSGHTAIIDHTAMHMFGGCLDARDVTDEYWLYDFEIENWHLLNTGCGPSPRQYHSAISYQDAMWVYGGIGSKGVLFTDMWLWSYGSRYWKRVQQKNKGPEFGLHSHSACVLNNSMFVYGGIGLNDERNDNIWIFNLAHKKWTQVVNSNPTLAIPPLSNHVVFALPRLRSSLGYVTSIPAAFTVSTAPTPVSPARRITRLNAGDATSFSNPYRYAGKTLLLRRNFYNNNGMTPIAGGQEVGEGNYMKVIDLDECSDEEVDAGYFQETSFVALPEPLALMANSRHYSHVTEHHHQVPLTEQQGEEEELNSKGRSRDEYDSAASSTPPSSEHSCPSSPPLLDYDQWVMTILGGRLDGPMSISSTGIAMWTLHVEHC